MITTTQQEKRQKMSRCCSQCGSNGHNSRTCDQSVSGGGREIMLFGVRVKVDPLRKTVSRNDISSLRYEQRNKNVVNNGNAVDDADAGGYFTTHGHDAGHNRNTGGPERNPWTEEEHKRFLLGLYKVGKGGWSGISTNFVKTRTPKQVASHAQKYYLRKNNLDCGRRNRRLSLFDIPTDSVTIEPMDNGGDGVHGIANNMKPVELLVAPWPIPVYGGAPKTNRFAVAPSLKLSLASATGHDEYDETFTTDTIINVT